MSNAEILKQVSSTCFEPIRKTREACRCLAVRNGKILLTYEKNKDVYMSPGGGVEDGESLDECCAREVMEESGLQVNVGEHLYTIYEYVFDELYIAHYFLCEVTGEGKQALTPTEIDHGVMPVWLEIDKAIEIFSHYEEKTPDHESLYLREYTILNKLKEKLK
ncbi:MAG: NUDIX domain-containing protein [Clostridia bacterium]|nr:NUDIX domain-containing protein [Clostridia bacterium]